MLLRAALSAVPRPRPGTLPAGTSSKVLEVSLEHLIWYQEVCLFRKSELLPATYPHVLAFDLAMAVMTRSDFPFPVIGLVHVANRIEQRRRLTATDRFTMHVRATDLREHPRGRQFDLVTTAECDGEEVWRDTSTYLRREKAGPKEPRGEEKGPVPQAIWRVGGQVGPAYARVSGDHNPIHTSRLGARLFGFPRPIAHGMWTKARCLAALEGRLPEAFTIDVAFKLPIPLPSKVGFIHSQGELAVFNARNGKPHLSGRIAA
ncbi:MAG TPA: MaoC/PaaZ C-terminal domain-containing protein [Candidatus Limnocylindrales bacterium]|nr:MaoC/PaaZ C-terminal domain-containing protein [Candidatus Limnocylindrales bacterium]